MFYYSARNRQVPQRLTHGAAEHDPGRMPDAAQFVQKKYLGDLSLSVLPGLHKKPVLSDFENIADKYLTQDRQNGSCRKK